MSVAPICFIQSGDFRLDAPLAGLESLPAALRELVLAAPYDAAARVFDAALAERVDFMVLTGNLCNLHAPDPKAVGFLREQFTRLTDCGIEAYLAGGENDPPELWPAALPLPEGVRWFASEAADQYPYRRGGETLAVLCGTSRGERFLEQHDYQRPHEAPLAIAVAGRAAATSPNVPRLLDRNFNYWALGGRAQMATLAQSPTAVHYAGTPQGMSPAEDAAGGCTLVRLDGFDGPQLQRIETDALRYHTERVGLGPGNSKDDLEMLLFERLASLAEATAGRHLLVTLEVAADDQLATALFAGGVLEGLLSDLRGEFGGRESAVWPVALAAAPPQAWPAAWLEEDSVLGEYLRTLLAWSDEETRGKRGEATTRPDLAGLVPREDAWAALEELNLHATSERQTVLREATALGASLLAGNTTTA